VKTHTTRAVALAALVACASWAAANGQPRQDSPQAPARTHTQNFKDMVLAECLATAYRESPGAARDAGSSVSALRDWTLYDLEQAPEAIKALISSYLDRNYRNPLAEPEAPGVRFDFLKCLDLYHSRELDAQARRLVIQPGQRGRRDK
jgi:hypothetical protein